jgi:hypothetical protein
MNFYCYVVHMLFTAHIRIYSQIICDLFTFARVMLFTMETHIRIILFTYVCVALFICCSHMSYLCTTRRTKKERKAISRLPLFTSLDCHHTKFQGHQTFRLYRPRSYLEAVRRPRSPQGSTFHPHTRRFP